MLVLSHAYCFQFENSVKSNIKIKLNKQASHILAGLFRYWEKGNK